MNARASLTSVLTIFILATITAVIAKDLSDQLPAGLISYRAPTFPAQLKRTLTTDGYTTVGFIVKADGQIDEAVVLEATHPGFGESVLQVLPIWRFQNAGNAVPRREVLRFMFQQTGAVTPLSHSEATKAAFPASMQERLPIRTVQWSELKSPPVRLASALPAVKATRAGTVAVSYVIDTAGRVRIPVVVGATEPSLGAAVIEAVKQWRFAPPMHEGMPVLVEDRRSFSFKAMQ